MDSSQKKGRACYKRGLYQRAAEHFDRAIEIAPSVQLLDNRAACHEKLNDLQAALKDAKKAIQLHREDATGYLRAGRVLRKMDKDSVALEIYTHGLKSIKHVGQGFELLREAEKELMTKFSPPTSVDPLTLLPRELAEVVLRYLSFKQRVNACRVSKQWASFIRSCPDLWQHLDMSGARRQVRNSFVSRAINIARQKLTSATINSAFDFERALAAVIKHCRLQELTILQTGFQVATLTDLLSDARHLKSLTVSSQSELRIDHFERLFHRLHDQLELLNVTIKGGTFSNFPTSICSRLRSLEFNLRQESNLYFQQWSDRMPSLESLTFRVEDPRSRYGPIDLENCHSLKHLDLAFPRLQAAGLKLPPSLESLRLVSTTATSTFWYRPVNPLCFSLPNLKELSLEIPELLADDVLPFLGSQEPQSEAPKPSLRKLSILSSNMTPARSPRFLRHRRLVNLEQLCLKRTRDLDDEHVDEIMDALPKLRVLDLSETNVTGVAVKRVVKSGSVEQLDIYNCRHVGPDAIEWAREQGVRVRYQVAESTANGGRKIRH